MVTAFETYKLEQTERYIGHSRRLGSSPETTALGLDLMAQYPGRSWRPICCWCAEGLPFDCGTLYRLSQHSEGVCHTCGTAGRDVLVGALPVYMCR